MTDSLTTMVAVIQQLILGFTFIFIPIAAQKYGQRAQNAAEKEVARQGFDEGLLLKNGVKMTESKVEMLLPLAFAAAYLVLATIGLSGGHLNQTLLWLVEGFTLLIVGMVTAQQVFVATFLNKAFKKSKDVSLHKINVEAFVAAASKEFPGWLRPMQVVRFLAASVGSAVVIILLCL